MFVRILVVSAALLVAIWLVLGLIGAAELRQEETAAWPFGLGTVREFRARPRQAASPEATELTRRLATMPELNATLWIAAQMRKKDDAIDPPPAVNGREKDVDELARFIVASGDRIVWPDDDVPVARINSAGDALTVRALQGGPTAWDAVHATWILGASLCRQTSRPFLKSLGQRLERVANAAARKLAGAPPWTAEMTKIDPRVDAAASLQEIAARAVWQRRTPARIVAFMLNPMIDRLHAKRMADARRSAEAMVPRRCTVEGTPQHKNLVDPAVRFDAELEATAKLLALKSRRDARTGEWPPPWPGLSASRCADTTWSYVRDGRHMSLRMSREPASEPSPIVSQLDFRY